VDRPYSDVTWGQLVRLCKHLPSDMLEEMRKRLRISIYDTDWVVFVHGTVGKGRWCVYRCHWDNVHAVHGFDTTMWIPWQEVQYGQED
jgi:hypothetical protein